MNCWIAVQVTIVGNPDTGYEHCHHWDRTTQDTRGLAISHGFAAFGSDDFNVGEIRGNVLVWWGWMDEPLLEDLEATAAALGLWVRAVSS